MLLLTSITDVVRVITGSAANVTVHASYVDNDAGAITPDHAANATPIVSAATTTVVGSPGSGVQRNVKSLIFRNTHASVSTTFEVQHYDGVFAESLWGGTLAPGEMVLFDQNGDWKAYNSSGFEKLTTATTGSITRNVSTTTVSAAFATDTYLAGSAIAMQPNSPLAGSSYYCMFDMVKTGAGTAAFTVNVRFGTAGTTSDTSILSLAFAVGTAVADTGRFEVWVDFRSVGSGTSAIIVGSISCRHNLAATGLISTGASGHGMVTSVSSGFNSTPGGSILGISVNGGTSFSGTNTIVQTQFVS